MMFDCRRYIIIVPTSSLRSIRDAAFDPSGFSCCTQSSMGGRLSRGVYIGKHVLHSRSALFPLPSPPSLLHVSGATLRAVQTLGSFRSAKPSRSFWRWIVSVAAELLSYTGFLKFTEEYFSIRSCVTNSTAKWRSTRWMRSRRRCRR